MRYVLQRTDGAFVAQPGGKASYTPYLQRAQFFRTREEAEAQRCPGNELVVDLDSIIERRR